MDEIEEDSVAPTRTEIYPTGYRKEDLPDYKPGPLKEYTVQEIKEYMKEKGR